MCGPYRLSRREQIIAEHFDVLSDEDDCGPRYNMAPTQPSDRTLAQLDSTLIINVNEPFRYRTGSLT